MKKYYFFIYFLFISVASVLGQTAEPSEISGKLIKKSWSKTQQSYCAGGSDYYVLKAKNNKETILDVSHISKEIIAKRLKKAVSLTGTWETFVKTNDDPMAQQPVNPPMCEIFTVKSLK